MRRALELHPSCHSDLRIKADVAWTAEGDLVIAYDLAGDLARARIPPRAPAAREDGLWKTTCFEAFFAPGDRNGYLEFNFSPSSRWAAYRFEAYRSGMASADVSAPRIETSRTTESFRLRALIDLPPGERWRVGLSAVVEASDGSKSYWALAHPPGQPDFHHSSAFVLGLPPKERA